MSLLKRGKETRAVTLESILGADYNNQALAWSGVPVTPRSALGHPAVYRCRQLICGKLAAFPWNVYTKRSDGTIVDRPEPPLLTSPSGVVNRHTWRWQAVESLVFDGNIVGRVAQRNKDDLRPTQIELVPVCEVIVKFNGFTKQWEWQVSGKHVDREDIWHVAFDPPPGHILGRSLLEHAAQSIDTGIASQRYSGQFYGDGANPTMIMRNTKKTMSKDDSSEVKERVLAVLRSRREPLVVGADWEVKPWQVSPADAQLVQVWARNSTDVANYFGVPPEYVAGATSNSMTYSNLGARRQDLVALCFSIWGDPIESGLTDTLPRPQYVRIDYEDFIRGDLATISAIDERDVRSGLKTPNEVRKTRGLPPIDGGDRLVWPPYSTSVPAAQPAPTPAV